MTVPHPNPLPGGEGEPSAALGLISVSAQFHGGIRSCGGIRSSEAWQRPGAACRYHRARSYRFMECGDKRLTRSRKMPGETSVKSCSFWHPSGVHLPLGPVSGGRFAKSPKRPPAYHLQSLRDWDTRNLFRHRR
jgi:hypothetical protein